MNYSSENNRKEIRGAFSSWEACPPNHCACLMSEEPRAPFWFVQSSLESRHPTHLVSSCKGGGFIFYMTRTCQERHSNVLTKPVRLCRQEQLIRQEHSVSGHMCTGGPVSQHTTGKRCRGGHKQAGDWPAPQPTRSRHRGMLWSRCPKPLARSPEALFVVAGRGGNCGLYRPLHNLSSLQDWTHSEMCLCVWFLLSCS